MTAAPLDILRSTFGFESFRGQQAEIIDHVVAGGDALVLMPTGGGKSLCYQVPALCRPGTAIVVSPLIALMQDQVAALRQYGVRAAALNSGLDYGELRLVEQEFAEGTLDLLYVAPERLFMEGFLEKLARSRVALFAIDEAHCVSQWGHDFRPEYRQLNLLGERFPEVPRIALTATADGPTRRDILTQLELDEARVFIAGFDRPNIRYRVQPKVAPRSQLQAFLEGEQRGQSGIIYCLSRKQVEATAAWLNERGLKALPYHAGLDKAVRNANQERFLKEEGLIIVATIAFGMGIDKPDVRFVAHLDLPKSLEAYYQETGRAGRDGLPAEAWMLYGLEDVAKLQQFILGGDSPDQQKRIERQKLDALLGYCETAQCRRQVLLSYFGETLEEPCGNCDACLEPTKVFDGTEAAQKALSCVYRTGQRFGAMHIIDVLLGGEGERIEKLGHDKLSTYGIGTEYSREAWRSIIRQLAAAGLLRVDVEGHGGLHLTPESRAVLRGERSIELRQDPSWRRKPKTAKGRGRAALAITLAGPEEEALFQALRARRQSLAKEQGVPPYVIFHDTTLLEMAQRRPRDREDFATLSGVGAAKLERYAEAFLAVGRGQARALRRGLPRRDRGAGRGSGGVTSPATPSGWERPRRFDYLELSARAFAAGDLLRTAP